MDSTEWAPQPIEVSNEFRTFEANFDETLSESSQPMSRQDKHAKVPGEQAESVGQNPTSTAQLETARAA